VPYALLLACLFVFGVWPRLLTDKINPDAGKIVAGYQLSMASSPSGQSNKLNANPIGNRHPAFVSIRRGTLAIENK